MIFETLVVVDSIAYPRAISPTGTTLIGTTLLVEVIVKVASTVSGRISTSTISPALL